MPFSLRRKRPDGTVGGDGAARATRRTAMPNVIFSARSQSFLQNAAQPRIRIDGIVRPAYVPAAITEPHVKHSDGQTNPKPIPSQETTVEDTGPVTAAWMLPDRDGYGDSLTRMSTFPWNHRRGRSPRKQCESFAPLGPSASGHFFALTARRNPMPANV